MILRRNWFLPAWVLALLLPAGAAFANRAAELAEVHLAVMGGEARVKALATLQASGYVDTGGQRLRFALFAARPNRVRIETEKGGRSLVQATDGEAAPWEYDTGTWPPRTREMPEAPARTFLADAEFDDPLIAGEARGYKIEDAGEAVVSGRNFVRLRVTRKPAESFAIYVDAETYLVMMRVEQRRVAGGRAIQIVTHYDDFRPVEGVLMPHQIVVVTDNRVTQQTVIERMIPNPKLAPDIFQRPSERAEK